MTKSEFWKNAVPKNVKGQVVTAAVFAYISAAMTLVLGFLTGNFLVLIDVLLVLGFLTGNFLVLIDVLLVLGLGLGVHLAKSRVCAIILAAYFVLNKVLQWLGGEFSGLYMAVIFIIGFVMGVVGTFAFQKQWKEYQAGYNAYLQNGGDPNAYAYGQQPGQPPYGQVPYGQQPQAPYGQPANPQQPYNTQPNQRPQ